MGLSACRLLETLGQGSDHNQWNVCDVKKKLTVEVGTLTWVASDYSISAKCPMKVMAEVPVSTVSDSRSDCWGGARGCNRGKIPPSINFDSCSDMETWNIWVSVRDWFRDFLSLYLDNESGSEMRLKPKTGFGSETREPGIPGLWYVEPVVYFILYNSVGN